MSTMFGAGDVPIASRRDYWQHVVGDALGGVEISLAGVHGSDQLLLGELGAVRVGLGRAHRAGESRRTAKHIRQSDPDLCKINILAGGRAVIAQDGREAKLRPGDLTLVDLSRPVRWTTSPMRMVFVTFPRTVLPLRPDDLARLTAVPITGDRGSGALISSLARQLPEHLDDCGVVEGTQLGAAVLDLLTVGMAARLDRAGVVSPETRQRALQLRIHAFIEERLGDPELSPVDIAAAHHISLRYLYKLFREQNATVAGWVRQRRLERCRRDLLDAAQLDRPVSAIAARWGIPNATHFSRAFRAKYGITPGEYRRAHGWPEVS